MIGKWLVRYYLEHGHAQDVLAPDEATARRMVAEWASGQHALRGEKRIHGVDEAGRSWAVDLSRVLGVMCDRIVGQPGAVPAGRYQPGMSGGPN